MKIAAPHPEIWALSRLLEPLGVDDSLSFALGVAGGAGFLSTGFRYGDEFSNFHISGWNPFQANVVKGAERLGLIGTLKETGGRRKADAALATALDGGDPVGLWVDGATLGLAPQVLDGMSPTVVVARELPDGAVEVGDGSADALTVTPQALAEARGRIKTHRNRLLTLTGTVDDLPLAVRGGLATLAVGAIGGPKGNSGPDGVEALADRLGGDGRGSWRKAFEGDRHLLGALVNLHGFVVREGGLLRGYQATYDRYAAELLGLAALNEVADAHERLAGGWVELAGAALPADVPDLGALRGVTAAWELSPAQAEQPFPLSAPETAELLAGLARRAAAAAVAERETLEQLRSVLRA